MSSRQILPGHRFFGNRQTHTGYREEISVLPEKNNFGRFVKYELKTRETITTKGTKEDDEKKQRCSGDNEKKETAVVRTSYDIMSCRCL